MLGAAAGAGALGAGALVVDFDGPEESDEPDDAPLLEVSVLPDDDFASRESVR